MKNKRARYNDFTGIADVTALARATNANAATAYANASVSATAKKPPLFELKVLPKRSQTQLGDKPVMAKIPTSGDSQQVLTSKFIPREPIEGMENVDDVD